MISYSFGNYGFLRQGKMEHPPLELLDLGVERRFRESYHFENADRASYGGYLLQYTLKGCGMFETYENREFCSEIESCGNFKAHEKNADGPASEISARSYELTPGTGFFSHFPENSRYYLPSADASPDGGKDGWEYFYLHIDGPAVLPFFETLRALSGPVFSLAPASPPVALFFQLIDRLKRGEMLALYEGSEFLYRFLTQLLRELEAPSAEGSPLVRQACAYLRAHFSELEGISEAAGACGVSQAHLTRAFHAETGQTPLQYLTRLRIEHGMFLLLNTKDSIEHIAVACGFLNGNYFAKVFRRYLNCSPEEYRRRNRC